MKRTEPPGSRWLRPHRIDVIDTRPLLKWLAQATNRIHVDAQLQLMRSDLWDICSKGMGVHDNKATAEDRLDGAGGSKRDSAILHLVVLQGLRVAEVSRLNRSDIKHLDGIWTIDIQGKGMDGKVSQPLQDQTRHALLEWMDTPSRSSELFLARSGERCSPDRISRICKQWLRRSGLDDSRITAHSLRHTFATFVLAQGGGLEVVSKMLRHANLATTMIYAHIDRNVVAEQFERLGSVLSDGKSQ